MIKHNLKWAILFFFPLLSPSYAMHGMVVSEHHLASQIGADILRAGGNAVDAAVAMGYALAVVNPCCGNVGGGGFMLIRLADGKEIFLNFREKAPLRATKNMFQHQQSTTGYLAVGVPGTVLGLDTALQKYGTLPRKRVMAPAIQLAEQGFLVSPYMAKQFKQAPCISRALTVSAIFLNHGKAYAAGDRLINTI